METHVPINVLRDTLLNLLLELAKNVQLTVYPAMPLDFASVALILITECYLLYKVDAYQKLATSKILHKYVRNARKDVIFAVH